MKSTNAASRIRSSLRLRACGIGTGDIFQLLFLLLLSSQGNGEGGAGWESPPPRTFYAVIFLGNGERERERESSLKSTLSYDLSQTS